MIDLSEQERDTRVETLIAGDRVRWCGSVYEVTGRSPIVGQAAVVGYPLPRAEVQKIAVHTTTPARWGGNVSLVFPTGHFVAADLVDRPPAEPTLADRLTPAVIEQAVRSGDVARRTIRPSKRTTPRRGR